jgi:3'-phosphoadenosine 5'-phosphosulfate synthase
MGSVVRVKVLGSMELIDEGETDHKIIVLRESDPNFDVVNDMTDLERVMPGVIARLVDWLKNYKTSDGKPQNRLKQDEPTTPEEAVRIINEVSGFYQKLISGQSPNPKNYYLPQHH